ncbi:MAG: hypothetical protein AAB263_11075 [Planctomycetota bacterium]
MIKALLLSLVLAMLTTGALTAVEAPTTPKSAVPKAETPKPEVAKTEATKTQITKLDWCTIVTPLSVKVGEAATYTITLKKVPEKATKVSCDLHWSTTAGENKGMNIWGGDAKDIELNKPIVFTIAAAKKDDIGTITPIVYLSSDGTWNGVVGDQPQLPTIAVRP